MVVLTAVLLAAEGKADALEAEFKTLVPKVLKDPGALVYIVHRAVDNPGKFMVYEQYENQEAFQAHSKTEHFRAWGQATRGMFAGRAEIQFYNKVV
jgi:quinol monooxygenase YgiN